MKRFSLLTFCVVLAGCKTNISTDLFTSDLIAATEGETITAPLVIGMESPSAQKCEETAPAILVAVQGTYADAEFIGCHAPEYTTFARYRVQAEVLGYSDNAPTPEGAFAIGVIADGNTYHVSYLTNPVATKAIWDAMPEEMTQYRTFDLEPQLTAVLNNDLRGTVRITTDDVFADGFPVQGTATSDLSRRDQIELRMSDVTNAAFGSTDNVSHIVSFAVSQ